MSGDASTSDAHAHAPSHVRLLVRDVAAARDTLEALGFTVERRDAVFTQMQWAPGAVVYLVAVPAGLPVAEPRGAGVILAFSVDAGRVDGVVGRARHLGLVVDGPRDQPWHTREAVITGPEGYRLLFMERVPPPAQP